MYTRYRHAGSTVEIICLLGGKNTDKKTPKEDSELGYSNFNLALTFHSPHHQQKDNQLSPMHKKLKHKSGRRSKPGAQSNDDQHVVGSDSPDPTAPVICIPSVVSSVATSLSVVPLSISTFLELDATKLTLSSDVPPHQQARLSSQPPFYGAPSLVL